MRARRIHGAELLTEQLERSVLDRALLVRLLAFSVTHDHLDFGFSRSAAAAEYRRVEVDRFFGPTAHCTDEHEHRRDALFDLPFTGMNDLPVHTKAIGQPAI